MNSARITIIAEVGINHEGKMELARTLIDRAAEAGADFVKFQSFTAKGIAHQQHAPEQFDFFKNYELSEHQHSELADYCKSKAVKFLSTPFSVEAVQMLEHLNVEAYKIASCDLTNLILLAAVARTRKPVFMSTGMSVEVEIDEAVTTLKENGATDITLLHCITQYPTPYSIANLKAIDTLRRFGVKVGYSDHTVGNHCCLAAVGLGARVVEKHFCYNHSQQGPDIACSCDSFELTELVRQIRDLELALGSGDLELRSMEEQGISAVARRSLFYAKNLSADHVLTLEDLVALRPALGLPPRVYSQMLGLRLKKPVNAGDPVSWEHFSDAESRGLYDRIERNY